MAVGADAKVSWNWAVKRRVTATEARFLMLVVYGLLLGTAILHVGSALKIKFH